MLAEQILVFPRLLRRAAIIALALLLSACAGFRPQPGPGEEPGGHAGRVEVAHLQARINKNIFF